MMTGAAQNNAAILEAPKARLKTITRPIPTPGPGELVVRNHAIAVNPVDWKIQDYSFAIKTYPTVVGSDGCGIVIEVGSSVTKFKVGDRVTGFAGVIYNNDINHGAWQTYTILREIATTKIPDSMSFQEGSVFSMAMATAATGIFVDLEIPRPTASVSPQDSGFLVWGASSSVGVSVLQVAKNLGFKVFATASPQHHQYLKSLGAFEVFDYRDPAVVEKFVASAKSAGTPIRFGFDAITEASTAKPAADALSASGGAGSKLVIVLNWPEKETKPDGIDVFQTGAYRLGTDQTEIGAWFFNEYLQNLLQDGSIVSAPQVEIVPGGIDGAQKAFDLSKAGVSGKKLVVVVD